MTKTLCVVLAPVRLKDGVDEATLTKASDIFQRDFVAKQDGILKRMLLKGADGDYADLVFFASEADAARIAKLEESSPECRAFFEIMKVEDADLPELRIRSFQQIKTYE
jgi:hypothetical protein